MARRFTQWSRAITKTVTVLVIIATNLMPLAPAFAQTATDTPAAAPQVIDSGSTTPNTTVQTPTIPPADSAAPTIPIAGTTNTSGTTATAPAPTNNMAPTPTASPTTSSKPASSPSPLSAGGTTAPTVSNPSLFTYQTIAPKVDNSSGALIEKIPLDIPPGRNSLQPDLSLNYNSQDMLDSMVGYNWSLSIPYIQRLNKTGTDKLYADNYFTSSVNGELASSTATSTPGVYYARVDDGSFTKYVFSNNTWTAYDKNGTRYEYGTTTQAQQYDAASTTQVYKWMLEEVRDSNDNYIKYTYSKDNDQIYPSQVTYTGHGSTDGVMSIVFATSTRPDPYIDYKSDFKVTTNNRISEIDAKVNGQLVRKYTLSYKPGNNNTRSLLSSFQETGQDSNGAQLNLPAMTFQYASTLVTWTNPGSFGHQADQVNVVADANGDGINDTAISGSTSCGNPPPTLYIDGVAVATPPSYNWACFPHVPVESGTRFFDVNGDGYADVVHNIQNVDGSTLYESTGSSTGAYTFTSVATTTLNIPPFAAYESGANATYTTGLLGNFNGEGYVDIAPNVYGVGLNASTSYLGNGNGWTPSNNFAALQPMPGFGGTPVTNSQLVDINGDGLDDWVYSDNNNTYFCLNTGTGWTPLTSCNTFSSSPWTLATSTYYLHSGQVYDRGMRFMDINGDGLPDFVRSYYDPVHGNAEASSGFNIVYLNTGSGWATSTITLPNYITTYDQFDSETNNEYADWNGDGIPDSLNEKNNATRQDVLTQINYPKGGNEQISYIPSPQTGTNPHLPLSVLLVSKIITNDNNGNNTEVDYAYSGGKLYLNSAAPQDRKFAGFAIITETHPDAIIKTYYNQGDIASTTAGEQTDSYAQIGRIFRQDTLSTTTNVLLKRDFYKWNTTDKGNSRSFVSLADQLTQDFDSTGTTHRDHVIQYTYSTTTGDLLQSDDLGEVSGNSDGTYADIGSDTRIKNYTYATSTSSTLDLVDDITLINASSTKFQETQYYYDNLALGSVSLGNQTEEADWITGSSYASSTKVYNSYGLVASSTDPDGNKTTYGYDNYNFYPATSTNALNQSTTYLYDYTTGKTATTTDPNGLVSATVFDPVGRVIQQKVPDLITPTTLDVKQSIAYTDTGFPTYTTTTNYLSSATSTTQYEYFDGLGRSIQTRAQAAPTNTYTVKDKIYGPAGLVVKESLPYFASSVSWTSATTTSALFTSHIYDPLQRILTDTNAVGSTTYTYAPWHTIVTDANGNIKDNWDDAFGNLVNVVEHSVSTSSATTTYAYDINNNITNLTDALGNVRNFTYDGMDRRLTAQDLHASGDTSFGTWNYTYDDANNLSQTVDPKSQTVNYTYDALNRVLSEDYTGQSGVEVSYGYDTCTYGILQLCSATTTDAVTNLTYNSNGSVATQNQTMNAMSYATSYGYDRLGNITDITYPDTSIVHYGYDAAGRVSSVSRKSATSTQYINAINELDYAPTGDITLKRFGNGVVSSYTYDPNQLYRLTNIFSTASSTVSMGGGSGGALSMIAKPNYYAMASGNGSSVAYSTSPIALATKGILTAEGNLLSLLGTSTDSSTGIPVVNASSTPQTSLFDTSMLPSDLNIDGQVHTLNVTDDNTGEDLIISADRSTYTGLSQAPVYFSIKNTSNAPQTINLNFYFSNGQRSVSNIERLNVTPQTVSNYTKSCTQVAIATSTKNKTAATCTFVPTSSKQEVVASDNPTALLMGSSDQTTLNAELALGSKTRKSVNGYVSANAAQDTIQPGQTAYYSANINFPVNTSGEFYIEAVGNNGGYGQLDPWYTSNWLYRKQLTIAGALGAGTNYQVLLKVGESASSTGTQFDLGGYSGLFPSGKGNGGDLRFTESDGSTQLNYWVEDVTGTAPNRTAYVWVKVPDDLGTNANMYVYYGNSAATNASNGAGTFVFFDDFNTGAIDNSKWTSVCSSGCNITGGNSSGITESGDVLTQTDSAIAGSASRLIASTTSIDTSGYAVARRFERTNSGTYANTELNFDTDVSTTNYGTSTPYIYQNHYSANAQLQSTNYAGTTMYGSDLSANTWYREEARRVSSNVVEGTIWDNSHTILGTDERNVSLTGSVTDTEYPSLRSGDGYSTATDWVLVRKYSATEPAFSVAGSQETVGSTATWQYRKQINIGGQSGAGTNYQVLLKIGESGGATGAQFDLGGHSSNFPSTQNNGGDLRFADTDGVTNLNFWVEDVYGTAPNRTAYVWVKVPDDLGSNQSIYVYYGNSTATSTSNGFNTFNFFDNFDSGSIDGKKWTTICATGCNITGGTFSSVSISGGALLQADQAQSGSLSRVVATSSPFDASGYAVRRRFERTNSGTYANTHHGFSSDVSDTADSTTTPEVNQNHYWLQTNLSVTGQTDINFYPSDLTQNTWYRDEAQRASSTQVSAILLNDSQTTLGTTSETIPTLTTTAYPYLHSGDGFSTATDWVLVRKYHSPEPAFTSASSEQFVGSSTSTPYVQILQNISYTYDPVGNITQIADHSDTGVAKIANFAYDDLYRLTSASTTVASSTPFTQTYSYNLIGDLTNKSDVGAYTYAGNTGTNYANPDAPTMVGSTNYLYDNDGNIIGAGPAAYSWSYRNLMATSTTGSATSTYGYDYTGQRVRQTVGGVSTYYPNKYASIATLGSQATTTDYIYAGNTLIATVESYTATTSATSTRYILPDQLNSTNVVTDQYGNLAQSLDYYPYGTQRLNTSYAQTNEKHKYIGQQYDESTQLSYLNARYYDGTRGQFLSEDPRFLGNPSQQSLRDPQSLNAYSYSEDNPINKEDPTGLTSLYQVFTGQATWGQYWNDVDTGTMILGQSPGWNFGMNHPYTTGALVGVGSIPALYSSVEAAGAAYAAGTAAYLGGGASFIAQQSFAALVYSSLTANAISGNLGTVSQFAQVNPNQPKSIFGPAGSLAWNIGSSEVGGYAGATLDAIQFGGMLGQVLGSAATNLYSNSVQTRTSAANQFNTAIGSGSSGGGGGGQPSNNSLWVTPSGAVVNWGGQLVSAPPSSK